MQRRLKSNFIVGNQGILLKTIFHSTSWKQGDKSTYSIKAKIGSDKPKDKAESL